MSKKDKLPPSRIPAGSAGCDLIGLCQVNGQRVYEFIGFIVLIEFVGFVEFFRFRLYLTQVTQRTKLTQ